MNKMQVRTPLGPLTITEVDSYLVSAQFEPPSYTSSSPILLEALSQLEKWFAGEIKDFDLPLNPQGTPFQKSVWQEMLKIPWGNTVTYGNIATALGKPNAGRAVGGACGANPLPIFIPCHRVLGTGGRITGYTGGLSLKRWLLEHEGVVWKE